VIEVGRTSNAGPDAVDGSLHRLRDVPYCVSVEQVPRVRIFETVIQNPDRC
jgi:hypothetical protein